MRFQPVFAQRQAHGGVRDAHALGQCPRAPVGFAIRLLVAHKPAYLVFHGLTHRPLSRFAGFVPQQRVHAELVVSVDIQATVDRCKPRKSAISTVPLPATAPSAVVARICALCVPLTTISPPDPCLPRLVLLAISPCLEHSKFGYYSSLKMIIGFFRNLSMIFLKQGQINFILVRIDSIH